MNIHPSNVLFLDIETIPNLEKWQKDLRFMKLFEERFRREIQDHADKGVTDPLQSVWLEQAGFLAEFNTIVCVCVGVIVETSEKEPKGKLYIKALVGPELEILTALDKIITKMGPGYFCGHNGVAFDFPILQRKFWMHGLPVPKALNNMGKKPWETNLLDTMTMWSLGEYRAKISLDRLAMALGLASPKTEFSGADVLRLWTEGRIADIATYCRGDVKTLVNTYLRLTEAGIAVYEDTDLILK